MLHSSGGNQKRYIAQCSMRLKSSYSVTPTQLTHEGSPRNSWLPRILIRAPPNITTPYTSCAPITTSFILLTTVHLCNHTSGKLLTSSEKAWRTTPNLTKTAATLNQNSLSHSQIQEPPHRCLSARLAQLPSCTRCNATTLTDISSHLSMLWPSTKRDGRPI